MRVRKIIERSMSLGVPTLIATFAVAGIAFAATTISTDINTGGNLTVGILSTLTGGYVSQASSTVVGAFTGTGPATFNSTLGVTGASTLSSTLGVSGLSTLGGYISTASSTVVGPFTTSGGAEIFGGAGTFSSTLGVTGLSTLGGFISTASSTVTGNLTASALTLSGTATSTGANGFNLTGGCFSVNGTCITASGGGASLSAANTWTALQLFTGAASSSLLSANLAYFGQTATSTFASNGALSIPTTLGVTGLSTLTGGYVSQASSTVVGAFTGTGPATFNSTLGVTGASTLSSTLGVTGLSTLTGGYVSQASSTVVGALTVANGTTTIAGPGNSAGLVIGSTVVSQLLFGTCAVNPGAIAASTTVSVNCTATGVNAGSKVFVTPQNLPGQIIFTGASSTGANTIQVSLYNIGSPSGSVTPSSMTWSWMAIQ